MPVAADGNARVKRLYGPFGTEYENKNFGEKADRFVSIFVSIMGLPIVFRRASLRTRTATSCNIILRDLPSVKTPAVSWNFSTFFFFSFFFFPFPNPIIRRGCADGARGRSPRAVGYCLLSVVVVSLTPPKTFRSTHLDPFYTPRLPAE